MSFDNGYVEAQPELISKFYANPLDLVPVVESLRAQGKRVVLTMGSFDMLHIGHCRYLHEAAQLGDVLVVGLETDAKIQVRKGPNRPVVPQHERMEMLLHLSYVNYLTFKDVQDPRWHLIKLFRPAVLQATTGNYTDAELVELQEYCQKVVVQKRLAETSTSAKLRLLHMGGVDSLSKRLGDRIPQLLQEVVDEIRGSDV